MWELQEEMEEYLKRCRINLSDKSKLIQDCVRLEAQVSLTLTQLKTCLLMGDCDSRSETVAAGEHGPNSKPLRTAQSKMKHIDHTLS